MTKHQRTKLEMDRRIEQMGEKMGETMKSIELREAEQSLARLMGVSSYAVLEQLVAKREAEEAERVTKWDAQYRIEYPGICKMWLESEIRKLEFTKLSFLEEKEKAWKLDRMNSVVKEFLATSSTIYSSAGMSREWLGEEYDKALNLIRDIAND